MMRTCRYYALRAVVRTAFAVAMTLSFTGLSAVFLWLVVPG